MVVQVLCIYRKVTCRLMELMRDVCSCKNDNILDMDS